MEVLVGALWAENQDQLDGLVHCSEPSLQFARLEAHSSLNRLRGTVSFAGKPNEVASAGKVVNLPKWLLLPITRRSWAARSRSRTPARSA